MKDRWFKNNEDDKVWWLKSDAIGEFVFSFDKHTRFNLFRDYPHKLSNRQIAVFDEENPRWAEYFSDRKKG